MPAATSQPRTHGFEAQIGRVMDELRAAVSRLIDDLPVPVRRAVDLERALRLDRKLAWQLFRLSRSTGLDEVTNVPSLTSMARVRDSAKSRGVPEATLKKLSTAFERFDAFAIEHCGDRGRLASIASGLSHERSEGLDLRVRKDLYRGNSHLWGLHAEVLARTVIYDPRGAGGSTEHSVLVSGSIGLQGLRRGEPLTISSWISPRPIEAASLVSGSGGAAPGGLTVEKPGYELLTPFCSPNLPPVMHVPGRSGMIETEMAIPAMGRPGAITLYLSQTSPTAGDARTVGVGAGMFVSVPAEAIVTEILAPAGYTSPASARVAVFGRRHHPERVFEERAIDLLPQRERAIYLGGFDTVPPITGAARHHEAVRTVLEREGLREHAFDVYRCRVEYPAMHSLIVMRVDGVHKPR